MRALAGFVLAFWLIGLAVVVTRIRSFRRWGGGKLVTITVPLTEPADDVQPVDPRTAYFATEAYLEAARRGRAEPVKWAIVDGFLEVLER